MPRFRRKVRDSKHARRSRFGYLLATLLYGAVTLAADTPRASTTSETTAATRLRRIVIAGSINPATADFIHESLALARQEGDAALVIQMDTPGGLLDSAKAIVKDLLGAPLPVLVYVAPAGSGAISAGVFIAMAAHVAAMAPGTNIGAAHPVGGQGEDIAGDMRAKVENFTASLSKSIAAERGRNVEWAEQAVRESVSASEREALQKGVVDYVATDLDDLLRQTEGRLVRIDGKDVALRLVGARIIDGEMRLSQKFLNVIADPNIAYLFMTAAMLGLYVEFTNPGLIFPGVAGAIALLLSLAALQVLPINYSGLGLTVLGLGLLIGEIFLPSFGVLGVGGLVSFVLGSLLLFDTANSDLALNPSMVYAAAGTLAAYTMVVAALVLSSQRRRPVLGAEGLVGSAGEVRSPIASAGMRGKVLVHGELWNASATEAIEAGATVTVEGVEGLELRVRRRSSDTRP